MTRTRMITVFVAAWLAISGAISPAKGDEPLLTRSIYVPVIFSVTPEIAEELLIWIGDEEKPRRVTRHTFMFTIYPDKGERFWPSHVEVRLKAAGVCDGDDLDTNFVVTPLSIHTGERALEFDTNQLQKQVRTRRDVRMDPKVVRIRCGSEADTTPDAAIAGESES